VLSAYAKLVQALNTDRPSDFDAIPLGGDRMLTNPQVLCLAREIDLFGRFRNIRKGAELQRRQRICGVRLARERKSFNSD